MSDDLHRAIPYTPFFGTLYDILVENGASVSEFWPRDRFVSCEALSVVRGHGPSLELRIIRSLGGGGKLHYNPTAREFYVDGYCEDETPATLAIEERINAALAEFCATWTGPSPWRAP